MEVEYIITALVSAFLGLFIAIGQTP